MDLESIFTQTVLLLVAAEQGASPNPARIALLRTETGRLRRQLLEIWRRHDQRPRTSEAIAGGLPFRRGRAAQGYAVRRHSLAHRQGWR